ncbi:peptidase M16 [Aeromonas bestiarum]|uniref:M16 family metallopeptidase n=1 Tax=Aeromonas bestiarum TaxID=105751 RepID=UPI000CD44DD1|nr:pitrilysin family protein [Aeromonas bestiarum]POG24928.1 peptidase M16 [Aeromonas bestiarum]
MRVAWSLLYLFSALVLAGPVLVKEQKKGSNPLIVPYQQYRLDNGLTVILTQDHSDPLVHVALNYRVGLAEEAPGQSGMAHLFEHMMFQGSAHVGEEGHIRLLQQAGSWDVNGMTMEDQTRYYQTVPANQLEKVLWLEADRMGFLLDTLYQQKLDVQRDIIKNERANLMDTQPYGLFYEVLNRTLYPPNHPYFNTPFGRVADLDRLTLEDVRQFFLRWYGPNNATLVIGGDIQPAQTLAWVERYFGALPAAPAQTRPVVRPVTLKKSRYRTLVDRVAEPMLVLAYPTVSARDPGVEALDLLADQLGGSASGLLQRQLQQSGRLVSVFASHDCNVLACKLVIQAIPNLAQGAELGAVKVEIDRIIGQLAKDGVSREQLAHSVNALRAQRIWPLDSVAGKAEQLGTGYTLFQDPNYQHRYLERIARVTPAELQQALRHYVLHKPRVVLSVVPEAHQGWQAGPVNFVEPPPLPRTLSEPLLRSRPVKETLDRRQEPASGGALPVPLPTLWQASLGERVSLLGHYSDEVPAFAMRINWPGGRRAEPEGKGGLAELADVMLSQGSEQWQAATIEERARQLGANIRFEHGEEHSYIKVQGLTSHFEETLALVRELVQQPALRAADFERSKYEYGQWLQQLARDPQWQADWHFTALLDGDKRPDLQASLQSLTLDDVRAFYRAVYRSGEARVVVSGDLAQEKVVSALSFLVEPEGQSPSLRPLGFAGQQAKRAIYLLDNPGASQSLVRMGRRAMASDGSGEQFLAGLMNASLADRLHIRLREELGYTYFIDTTFNGNSQAGYFLLQSSVRTEVTRAALQQILQELDKYQRQGPTRLEVRTLREGVLNRQALDYETLPQEVEYMLPILLAQWPQDYVEQRVRTVSQLSTFTLRGLARRWLDPDDMVILVVGDAKVLAPELAALGWPVQRISFAP